MTRARLAGLATFLALAGAAMAAFPLLPEPHRWVAAAVLGLLALNLPGLVFARLASAEERRKELEERARTPPG